MSSSITTAGGVVVVTQVFSEDEDGKISLPVPSDAPPLTQTCPDDPPLTQTCPAAPAKVSDMTATFLHGEPQSLGIVQIFVGVVCVSLSLSSTISPSEAVQVPFVFVSATFILSGSLAVAARRGTNLGLISATLASSLLSVLLALLAVVSLCQLMGLDSAPERFCGVGGGLDQYPTSTRYKMKMNMKMKTKCIEMLWTLNLIVAGARGLVVVLMCLEVCVAMTICVFSGKAISRRGRSIAQTVMVVESGGALTANPASVSGSDTALLDSVVEKTASVPPPYSP